MEGPATGGTQKPEDSLECQKRSDSVREDSFNNRCVSYNARYTNKVRILHVDNVFFKKKLSQSPA